MASKSLELFEQRLNKAQRFAQWIAKHHHILMVALTGSMATREIKPSSDIDFFIQVNPGRLWSTRFWITLMVALLGERPSQDEKAGKICLNWWGTDNVPQKRGVKYRVLYRNLSKRQNLQSNWPEKILRILQTQRLKSDPALKKGLEIHLTDQELALRHKPLTEE
jgi:predicted nucleotidyltransferase